MSDFSLPHPGFLLMVRLMTRPVCWRAVLWVLTFFLWLPARAELVLSDFSASHPLKIMPVGDSITDDGVVIGAWRRYLQPLLETNGIPFSFVGRQLSTGSAGFTQIHHEGYSGAVIAAPGVMTTPVHGYPGGELYLQKIVADALTNATPDLVLVLMGANDLGRGRNPYLVATNHMPALLDLIFSNAPQAHIIINKAMTLQNAMAGSLNYGAFATNVPIYNAALQTLVNQRRALGQNVFLADMYSAVDYATMFNADHLHPNVPGVQAIAREWLTRIQAITISPSNVVTPLVAGGADWKYSDTGQDWGTNWAQADFDDTAWSSGPARLGYGLLGLATTVSYGTVSTNKYITTYFRHSFAVPDGVMFTNLNLRLSQAQGAVVWLNGREILRTNLPARPISSTNRASSMISLIYYAPYLAGSTNLTSFLLPAGTNVLAVELHQYSPYTGYLGFDLELMGAGYWMPPPPLSLALSGGNCHFSWPLTNGAGFSLHSTSNLAAAGDWAPESAPVQTNAGQITTTLPAEAPAKFFRLQKP